MSAPPPPPPHGEVPRGSGLPPGKYDIFVIPEHSSGSGFLYLPSLQPNVNSFAAGFASALILVAVFQSMAPAFRTWWETFNGLGGMAMTLLMLGIGFGAWSIGRTQTDGPSAGTNKPFGSGGAPGGFESTPGSSSQSSPNTGGGAPKPGASWQRSPPQGMPKNSWEKAREETRRKEEERRAKEAEQKRREEAAKRLAELRAKEAKERLEREKERERKEAEAKRKAEEQKQKNAAGSSYAHSGVGEKTTMWPNGKPQAKNPPSPGKRPPAPTAKTYVSAEDETYSFRPYDKPRTAHRRPSVESYAGSEASWAQSQTTARTSPPPSMRGPYVAKDPDKIVIQAVYLFMNQYSKSPASQLVSGVGNVTDGLILRITTEGLFIDDDVRGVPQREWDVKAWTLKHVEVWCPSHCLNSASAAASASPRSPSAPHLLFKMATARKPADRDSGKMYTGEDADAYLTEMLCACKDCCRLGLCERTFRDTNLPSSGSQAGPWKNKGLHVMRATVRDQDGKRYLVVMKEAEAWKLAVGLKRLKGGAQVRQLGLGSLSAADARGTLEMLGW